MTEPIVADRQRTGPGTATPDREAGQDGAAIRFRAMTKTFGSGEVAVHALRGINLDIEAGQFVVVLGPSGSGKTTLMNIVGGIESPTSGTVEVGDRQLTAYRRDDVGFVFQFFNLVPTLTAIENVALVAELVGEGEDDARAALESVGLSERLDHFTSALSGGEQQRVAIARALVKSPQVLLCDEPTGSLDADVGRSVLGVIHRLARARGRTVLLATHNSVIATMADRVLRLRSGEVVDDVLQPNPVAPEEVTW
jgi:putative ABC transport system ATP-binding protein